MTIHRFFVAPEEMHGDRFPVPRSVARQVRTVLRLRDGDRVVLLDGIGSEAECVLEGADCLVARRGRAGGEPAHRLTLVQALLKADTLEAVVRHATEIGVAEFRPVITERSVLRELSPRRLERLRAIAREAAEQSERGIVPPVHPPVRLAEGVTAGAVVLAERRDVPRLAVLPPADTLVVGPEGGFAPHELDAALAAGAVLAGLGPRILRSPTAALAGAAIILSRAGDFA